MPDRPPSDKVQRRPAGTSGAGTPLVLWPRRPLWRLLATLAIAVVLAGGFLAYLTPHMAINWEAIAALCGF